MALEDLQTESKIIGSILLNNELVEDDEFPLSPEYFNSRLSIICYSAIYNLFKNGLREITKFHISNYLQKFQEQFDYYNAAKGDEFLDGCLNVVELSNYEYYYTRLKKFAILRDLSRMGFDISPIYNEFEDNPICMASMLERFDNAKPEEIVNYFNNITNTVESKYEATITMKGGHAAEGLEEYFESLKEAPEVGLSLNGNILNAITRGARLQKFYIKSAATGVGKTRTLAATAAQIAVGEYYDIFKKQWIKVNEPQSALFTTAEQSLQDIQTIVLAFVSGVDEKKIINRTESDEERARIMRAITLIKASNLHIVPIGNYSIKSLTNVIKKYKYQQNIRYLFHDYLQSSINLMSDVSGLSKIGNLREDQLLLMLSTTLKDLSNKFNLFTMTSTQLNRSYKTEEELDATVIRGALSISDKADFGCIMNDISPEELDLVASINANNQLAYQPTTVTSVYKNRSNPYVRIKIYSHLDKATGQCLDLFALDQYNNVVNIQPTQIIQK